MTADMFLEDSFGPFTANLIPSFFMFFSLYPSFILQQLIFHSMANEKT